MNASTRRRRHLQYVAKYLGEKYADQRLGLISALQDQTIRYFFGFGLGECAGGQMSGALFTEGSPSPTCATTG